MKSYVFGAAFLAFCLSATALARAGDFSYVRTDRGVLFGVLQTTRGETTFRLDPVSPPYVCGALPTGCEATLTKLTPQEIATGKEGEPLLNPSLKRDKSVTVRICNLMDRSSSPNITFELTTFDCEVTASPNGTIALINESRNQPKAMSWSVSDYPGNNQTIEAVRKTNSCNLVMYYEECRQPYE